MELINAIVLSTVPHGENGRLVDCYTQQGGRQRLIAFSQYDSNRVPIVAHLQPLSILGIACKPPRQKPAPCAIATIENWVSLQYLRQSLVKNSIVFFISELLTQLLRQPMPNPSLYAFLARNIVALNAFEDNLALFHNVFMLELAGQLGYEPQGRYSAATPVFNLAEGAFAADIPSPDPLLAPEEARILDTLLQKRYATSADSLTREQKRNITNRIIGYLELHTETPIQLKTLPVLQEILAR